MSIDYSIREFGFLCIWSLLLLLLLLCAHKSGSYFEALDVSNIMIYALNRELCASFSTFMAYEYICVCCTQCKYLCSKWKTNAKGNNKSVGSAVEQRRWKYELALFFYQCSTTIHGKKCMTTMKLSASANCIIMNVAGMACYIIFKTDTSMNDACITLLCLLRLLLLLFRFFFSMTLVSANIYLYNFIAYMVYIEIFIHQMFML